MWKSLKANFRLEAIPVFVIIFSTLIFVFYDIIFVCNYFNLNSLCSISIERVILLLLSFLIIICLLFKKKIKVCSKSQSLLIISLLLFLFSAPLALFNRGIYKLHFLYNVISIFSFFLLIILFYKSKFANYIKKKSLDTPNTFLRKIANNNEYFIVAIIIIILTPIFLTFLINDLLKEQVHSSFLGVSYTLVGVFVTSLIYFKLKGKTTTLKEYMDELISILESSKEGDKIYIIGPTLFIGHEYSKRLHKSLKNILFEKIEQKVEFVVANLSIQREELTKISDNDKSTFLKNIKYGFKKVSNLENSEHDEYENAKNFLFIKNLLQKETEKEKKGLFDFHWKYLDFINDKAKDEERVAIHYYDLISFYQKLCSKINAQYNGSEIRELHWNYYNKPYLNQSFVDSQSILNKQQKRATKPNGPFKSNFFAVANITQGQYFFGQYKIYDDRDQEFHGTVFENRYIGSQMDTLLDEFIKGYPKNLQYDIPKQNE